MYSDTDALLRKEWRILIDILLLNPLLRKSGRLQKYIQPEDTLHKSTIMQ